MIPGSLNEYEINMVLSLLTLPLHEQFENKPVLDEVVNSKTTSAHYIFT